MASTAALAEEGRRICQESASRGLNLRLFGGVGFYLRAGDRSLFEQPVAIQFATWTSSGSPRSAARTSSCSPSWVTRSTRTCSSPARVAASSSGMRARSRGRSTCSLTSCRCATRRPAPADGAAPRDRAAGRSAPAKAPDRRPNPQGHGRRRRAARRSRPRDRRRRERSMLDHAARPAQRRLGLLLHGDAQPRAGPAIRTGRAGPGRCPRRGRRPARAASSTRSRARPRRASGRCAPRSAPARSGTRTSRRTPRRSEGPRPRGARGRDPLRPLAEPAVPWACGTLKLMNAREVEASAYDLTRRGRRIRESLAFAAVCAVVVIAAAPFAPGLPSRSRRAP